MAQYLKIGLNSRRKPTRSGLVQDILLRVLSSNRFGAKILTSMLMLSENSVTVTTTAGVRVCARNVFPEDALLKRMQLLR